MGFRLHFTMRNSTLLLWLAGIACGAVLIDLDHPLASLLGIASPKFLHIPILIGYCIAVAYHCRLPLSRFLKRISAKS